MNQEFEPQEKWLRQSSLILAGLIGIGVVIVQALISVNATDPPATIALLAFAIALPLLGTLVILNVVLAGYRHASIPVYLTFAYYVGEGSACVGVIAAFWHVSWIAGVLVVISGLVGLAIAAAYTKELQKVNSPVDNDTR